MGNVKTRRYERAEYLMLEAEVLEKVKHLVKRLHVPRYVDTKESFGDLDVVYCLNNGDCATFKNEVISLLNPKEVVGKDGTFHVEYKEFQIDFIHCPEHCWDIKTAVLDFGDLTMCIGLVLNKTRLKYSDRGLYLRSEPCSEMITMPEIFLTSDVKTIFEFLGLDYHLFESGYKDLGSLYSDITKSKFFYAEDFVKSGVKRMNKDDVRRAKNRPGFKKFLEYCDSTLDSKSISTVDKGCLRFETWDASAEVTRAREEWRIDLLEKFQQKGFYDKQVQLQKLKKIARERNKLISTYVQEVTGLESKSLGYAIMSFRNFYAESIKSCTFEEHLANHTNDRDLLLAIRKFFGKTNHDVKAQDPPSGIKSFKVENVYDMGLWRFLVMVYFLITNFATSFLLGDKIYPKAKGEIYSSDQ